LSERARGSEPVAAAALAELDDLVAQALGAQGGATLQNVIAHTDGGCFGAARGAEPS
jgi:hypothetical protein